ncbi:response regulator transcription factor [Rhizobium sp. WYJ-E13]|uniref:response regulator transcription factor n=1 Tax=Rhizobium sp. WYJ-E13 TaxID=2849093 RepID=UPI001C1ED9C1|nr:response regulator transcription factor [Rhizobium sp. WYJ-E13]QWW71201.1 response regulator transcription factor [Rhizobium sp. WYJ-E13]
MKLVIVTPIRLFGDGLAACLRQHDDIVLQGIYSDIVALRHAHATSAATVALIDVTQGIDLGEVRATTVTFPHIAFVALGLVEQRQEIIRCGRAGFIGYVDRDASVDHLRQAMHDALAGRLNCSAEVSGGLLRALFNRETDQDADALDQGLTHREGQVLRLIGDGLSNKEIANELSISIATVKHYVHHILRKLQICRRAQAMRRVRQAPWLAASPPIIQRADADGAVVPNRLSKRSPSGL